MLTQPTLRKTCHRTDCPGHWYNTKNEMVSLIVTVDGCHWSAKWNRSGTRRGEMNELVGPAKVHVQANYSRDGWHLYTDDTGCRKGIFIDCKLLPVDVQAVFSRMVRGKQ